MEDTRVADEDQAGQLNVAIDAGLKQRFKAHCAMNRITVKDAVTDALEAYMRPSGRRKLPLLRPLSK